MKSLSRHNREIVFSSILKSKEKQEQLKKSYNFPQKFCAALRAEVSKYPLSTEKDYQIRSCTVENASKYHVPCIHDYLIDKSKDSLVFIYSFKCINQSGQNLRNSKQIKRTPETEFEPELAHT